MAAKSKAQTTARAKISSGHASKKPVSRAASAKPVKSAAKDKAHAVKVVKAKVVAAPVKGKAKPVAKSAVAVKKPAAAAKPVAAKPASKVDPKTVASFKAAVAAANARAINVPPSAPARPVASASHAGSRAVPGAQAASRAVPAAQAASRAVPAAQAASRAVPAAHGKSNATRITAPVAPVTPKSVAEKAAAQRQMLAAQKKPVNQRHGFKTNEFVVYPAHGVGRIIGIEEQEIAGMSLELFVINFEKEKLTLRVPTGKLESVGMRKLAEDTLVKKAMDTLKGRARVKRTMWSRRAQEYVAKINSGDLISIAEVVRDLYRSDAQPEQSYSERQLYEDALDRMAREIAAVEKLDERGAVQRIVEILSKSAKGRRAAEAEAEAEAGAEAA
ncbi:MAG: CarD family transcriptional regulator [Hyphomicrobiaceae bacterium]|nr:CarD family transcriptional regulator [Hyphomicrobiaceae bacterium]